MNHPEFAISLGGSVIAPDCEPRGKYAFQFAILLKERVKRDRQRTAVVTGGGPYTRAYQNALREAGVTDPKVLDRIGILPTHVNARFVSEILIARGLRTQYLTSAHSHINRDMDVWVTGGTMPGQTTDAVLVQLARRLDIPTLINATNISYIYDITAGAVDENRPIQDMTWDQYLALLGNREHEPGENVPFGITASHKAQAFGLSVIVLDGNNLKNLQRVFEGKPFKGTVIHP